MTAPRREPAERPAADPYIPHQLSNEDLLELNEPSDYPTHLGPWFPGWLGPDDFPELRSTRAPEPDLEAEP
ncbi:MAG TPA: hypothetical protein VIY52_32615 [Streptosporangiaceae bacterium]